MREVEQSSSAAPYLQQSILGLLLNARRRGGRILWDDRGEGLWGEGVLLFFLPQSDNKGREGREREAKGMQIFLLAYAAKKSGQMWGLWCNACGRKKKKKTEKKNVFFFILSHEHSQATQTNIQTDRLCAHNENMNSFDFPLFLLFLFCFYFLFVNASPHYPLWSLI